MCQVEFVEAFDKVTEAVTKHEKGNLVYGLSKPADDDVTFYAYAGAIPSSPLKLIYGVFPKTVIFGMSMYPATNTYGSRTLPRFYCRTLRF